MNEEKTLKDLSTEELVQKSEELVQKLKIHLHKIFSIIIITVTKLFAMTLIWSWIIVPILGLPPITMLQILFLNLFFAVSRYDYFNYEKIRKESHELFLSYTHTKLLTSTITSLIVIGVGTGIAKLISMFI